MRKIDAHAHIFPPKIEKVATEAIREFYNVPCMGHEGSVEDLLRSGARAGVTNYLVFSTATTPKQVERINDYIISQCAEHSEFFGAGTMHREYGQIEAELARIQHSGIKGIKLHPDFQKFNFDDDLLLPMFDYMQATDMFVITHAGDYRYTFSHPERIERIAKMFPKLRIIAAHFGGWSQWEMAREILVLPNIYVDTSSTYVFGGIEQVTAGLKAFPREHIFYGCDFPMWDHKDEADMLASLGLSDDFLEDIYYNNFAKFIGLEK